MRLKVLPFPALIAVALSGTMLGACSSTQTTTTATQPPPPPMAQPAPPPPAPRVRG